MISKNIVVLSVKIIFSKLTMHILIIGHIFLGYHCFQNYPFRGFQSKELIKFRLKSHK